MVYLICKECYKKKYGHYPLLNYEDSDGEYVCFYCGEKKKVIKDAGIPDKARRGVMLYFD